MASETQIPQQVCFPISDVKPGLQRLPEITVREAMERAARTELLACPREADRVVESGDFHPLIAAATLAFKQHFPLVLSPDMIWLTILQGVAQHIANHHETLRSRLVSHATKIELVADTNLGGIPSSDAEMLKLTRAFTDLLEKHVQPNKRFLLKTEFSTTTDMERIVGAVVLMDAFQPYFDYLFLCICGIPSITLEGDVSDWELLTSKVRLLHESDLDLSWWTRHLLPLCDQFVRAARGEVDREHWQNLCKIAKRYGTEDLNGWLLKFIPYLRREKNEIPIHRNPIVELTSYEDIPGDAKSSAFQATRCTSNMLPTGISQVPVFCKNSVTGESSELQFLGGLVGVAQAEDFGIRAMTGWAIARPKGIDVLIARLRTQFGCNAPSKLETREMVDLLGGHLPGDMWRFYSEIEEVRIKYPKPNRFLETSCHIFGFSSDVRFRSIKMLWDTQSVLGEIRALREQGVISESQLEERKDFTFAYSGLHRIAKASVGGRTVSYVFGQIQGLDALIFRWDGGRTPKAFVPVAKTFTEWMESVLEAATPVR